MIQIKELAEILKANGNLEVTETSEGLLIKDKLDEGKVIPADLVNFVKVYEREPNIAPKGNGYVINTTEFSGQSFMMLLMSVFGAEYNFKVTGDFQVTATPKAKEGVREGFEGGEESPEEVDFEALAESLDEEGVEIELHEDGLRIFAADKTAIAEKIDGMNPDLIIEITNEAILVTGE
jgi:hypothetical protein